MSATAPPEVAENPTATRKRGWLHSFSAEQTLLINVVAALTTAIVGVYLLQELGSGLTTRLFVGSGLLLVLVGAAIVYNRLVDPLNAMSEPSAGRQSLADAVSEARLSFIGDVVARVDQDRVDNPERPATAPLSDGAFNDVNVLVVAALMCQNLVRAQPRIRDLIGTYVVALTAMLAAMIVIGAVVELLSQDQSTALAVLVFTVMFGGFALLMVGSATDLNLGRWRHRIINLRGLSFTDIKRRVQGWAEEDTQDD